MTGFIKDLLFGNQKFLDTGTVQDPEFINLVHGQSPKALIISCSDSRVNPDQIFNTKPGTLLVVRNIGGFVPGWEVGYGNHGTLAAIEFAVDVMDVESVVVLTHSGCRGISYGSSPKPEGFGKAHPNLSKWLESMQLPVSDHPIPDIEKKAATLSLVNLSEIPCVKQAQEERKLEVAAMYFDIKTGKVEIVAQKG